MNSLGCSKAEMEGLQQLMTEAKNPESAILLKKVKSIAKKFGITTSLLKISLERRRGER